jgi:hypothetical protein
VSGSDQNQLSDPSDRLEMNASSERDERNRGTSALEPAPMHPRQVAASRFCERASIGAVIYPK